MSSGQPDAVGRPWWMVCYVLVGFVQNGLLPVILPLSSHPGPTSGLSYAAFAATGLAAPLIGAWSDRHRRHRLTLAGGSALAGLALLLDVLPGGLLQHMALAAVAGVGVASAITVSNMFIVEVAPRSAWDRQISTLLACIGGGQLVGLLVAGVLGVARAGTGFLIGGGLLLLVVPCALALAPDPRVKVSRDALAARASRGSDATSTGPHRALHGITWAGVSSVFRNRQLVRFLAVWLVSYTATNGLAVMFPAAMIREFHVPATFPTTAYALGVGCSLLLYPAVGRWDARLGPWRVLRAGLALRAVLVAAMALLAAFEPNRSIFAILACFCATQIVWPLLSVASNSLAVTLEPSRQAENAGLLNAVTSIGATLGGVVAGIILPYGFAWLCAAVFAALLIALLAATARGS